MNPYIIRAIDLAFDKHEGQRRKGSRAPYIIHPLGVMNILLAEQAHDPSVKDEVVMAGVLHDLYEDTDISLEEIESRFGVETARLVRNASEPIHINNNDKRKTWRERKEHTIKRLGTLDKGSKLIVCADKYHNARSMSEDIFLLGGQMWSRFNAPKSDQKWYYQSCLKQFDEGVSIAKTRVYQLLRSQVRELFK